jgi:hypothetical protein
VADEQPAAVARDRFGGVDIIIHVSAALRLRRAGSVQWVGPRARARRFSGKYSHRTIKDASGTICLKAPQAFAKAVVEVDGF